MTRVIFIIRVIFFCLKQYNFSMKIKFVCFKRIFEIILSLALTLGVLSFSGFEACAKNSDVEEYVESQLMVMADEINISSYSVKSSELPNILNYVLKSSPWLFFVNSSFSYDLNSRGTVANLYPKYIMDDKTRAEAFEFCDYELEKILFYIPNGMSEFDLGLYLHDYICMNFDYDEKYESSDMYSMLKNKVGTCQGYTYLFLELAKRVGLDCDVVYSDSMRHIWNVIKIDGEWYHIDLTWDDGNSFGKVLHKGFLFSDSEAEERGYYSYTVGNAVSCTSLKYSGEYLNHINTAMAYIDGDWYLCDNSAQGRSVVIYNEDIDEAKKIIDIDGYWIAEGSYIYANCFSSAVSVFEDLYFNTKNKIYRYFDGELYEVYSSVDKKQIYYLATDGENIYFSLSQSGDEIDFVSVSANGDVNKDGKIDLLDIVGLSHAIENNDFSKINKMRADTSGDAKIDEGDAKILREILIRLKIDKTASV